MRDATVNMINRLEIQGSRVQTRLRSMDFFQDVKILSISTPEGTLNWGPESEISGSLKNLKPQKSMPLSKIYSAYSRPSNT